MGRGTTGIVCALTGRNFLGIDLYQQNVRTAEKNIIEAMKGEYDPKLMQAISKETSLIDPLDEEMTLETYLLADGSLSAK